MDSFIMDHIEHHQSTVAMILEQAAHYCQAVKRADRNSRSAYSALIITGVIINSIFSKITCVSSFSI
jgi:hypothetical protein